MLCRMKDDTPRILARIAALEDELRTAVHDHESLMFFQFKGKRVEFERSVEAAHRKLKKNLLRWLVTARPPT